MVHRARFGNRGDKTIANKVIIKPLLCDAHTRAGHQFFSERCARPSSAQCFGDTFELSQPKEEGSGNKLNYKPIDAFASFTEDVINSTWSHVQIDANGLFWTLWCPSQGPLWVVQDSVNHFL